MRKNGAPVFTNVSAQIDTSEIAYLPGAKVYLARRNTPSNQLLYLSSVDAGEGSFNADFWRSVEVPGLKQVTALQARITRASAVMIHGVSTAGQCVTLAVNLEEIGVGRVMVDADVPTATGLFFRSMVGEDTAHIEADRPVAGLQAGVNLVNVTELVDLFGPAAGQFRPITA